MLPHDDIQDGGEDEVSMDEGKDIYSEDTLSSAPSDTQLQEFQPQRRKGRRPKSTILHPSIHVATLSDAAYQDNYTHKKHYSEMDRKVYFWPVKKKIMEHSLLLLQREKTPQKVGNVKAEKFTTEPTLLAMNQELFNYLKGKSNEEDAIEIMYQLERLMERIVRTRTALRHQALLISQAKVLRAAGWRSVLRFAENQFAESQELLRRFRTRLHVLFPTSIQLVANERRKPRNAASTKVPPMEDGNAIEATETSSLSLEKETSQFV
jgi:hypothetical protein